MDPLPRRSDVVDLTVARTGRDLDRAQDALETIQDELGGLADAVEVAAGEAADMSSGQPDSQESR